jgi:hypothetical protein
VDLSENARRQSVLLHIVLAASLGAYGVILLILLGRTPNGRFPESSPSSPRVYPALVAVGAAQFGFATWAGRILLRSRRSAAAGRVRRYFLMRGASAEAIGIYGMLAGLLRAPLAYTVLLFALSGIALALCAPTREAWERAVRAAESSAP